MMFNVIFFSDETKVLVGENDTNLQTPLIAMRSFEYTDTTIKVLEEVSEGTKPPLVKVSVTSDTGFSFRYCSTKYTKNCWHAISLFFLYSLNVNVVGFYICLLSYIASKLLSVNWSPFQDYRKMTRGTPSSSRPSLRTDFPLPNAPQPTSALMSTSSTWRSPSPNR